MYVLLLPLHSRQMRNTKVDKSWKLAKLEHWRHKTKGKITFKVLVPSKSSGDHLNLYLQKIVNAIDHYELGQCRWSLIWRTPLFTAAFNIFDDLGFSATLTLLSAHQVQGGAVLPWLQSPQSLRGAVALVAKKANSAAERSYNCTVDKSITL